MGDERDDLKELIEAWRKISSRPLRADEVFDGATQNRMARIIVAQVERDRRAISQRTEH
jgi:hypothetical protein